MMAIIFPRGTIFGPFAIGDLLGSGLVSEVYEATTADGAVVAIKVLKSGALRPAKREARLGQEGFALADVVHVNVAGFRGEGAVDGRVYLAMERVYGIDLRRLMSAAGGLLPLARVVRIAYQAADGLAAVHARGFLHRDVKPENILVTPDDLVKITDFGSAWVGTFGVETTREQDLTSMLYASPEHLRGRGVGPASDVYALGLVLYEMAAGVHPIAPRPASAPEIFSRQLVFEPPPLHTLASDDRPIPRDLSDLVVRMIAKDPANRPASSDLGALLHAVLRPLLARHRASAGGSIVGHTTPMQARSSGGTIPMAAVSVAPASEAASSRTSDALGDVPGEVMREALPPPAPCADGGARGPATTPPRPPAAAWDPAAATLRSAERVPVTMPMFEVQPAERRSTAAPVERTASRASTGPSTGRRTIAVAAVVLGLGAAGATWLAVGRDDTATPAARPAPAAPQPPPVPSASASTSGTAAAPAAPRAAPAPRPAPRRGKIQIP